MVARRVIVFASLAVAVGSGVPACVGDDPAASTSDGKATGDRLGPCFPDGKCKEGLVCRDGEICLTPDEPKPVTDAGGASDATPDVTTTTDAAEAGVCTTTPSSNNGGPVCGASGCDVGYACCVNGSATVCAIPGDQSCPQTQAYWSCANDQECSVGLLCCVVGTASTEGTTSCAAKIKNARSTCGQPNQCFALGGRRTCKANTDCPKDGDPNAGECRLEEIQAAVGFTVVAQLCAP